MGNVCRSMCGSSKKSTSGVKSADWSNDKDADFKARLEERELLNKAMGMVEVVDLVAVHKQDIPFSNYCK